MEAPNSILHRLSRWKISEVVLTLVVYCLTAAVLAVALTPSLALDATGFRTLLLSPMLEGARPSIARLLLLAMLLAGSLYLFFFWGLVLVGLLVRLLSLGVRPGRHDRLSSVALFWMVLNGIYPVAYRIILPLVPMAFMAEIFYRLCGCRLGRGVRITTFLLFDPYLVEIGDRSMIGGDAVLSPHLYEGDKLYLAPVRIGADCLIGAHAFLSPGVTVGDGSTIGLRAYLRRGRRVPPGSRIVSVAGLGARETRTLERWRVGARRTTEGPHEFPARS